MARPEIAIALLNLTRRQLFSRAAAAAVSIVAAPAIAKPIVGVFEPTGSRTILWQAWDPASEWQFDQVRSNRERIAAIHGVPAKFLRPPARVTVEHGPARVGSWADIFDD